MQSNLKSALVVGAVVGLICVAAYPIVVVPLKDRSTREAPAGGFAKGSMWKSIDAAAKAKDQHEQQVAPAVLAKARRLAGPVGMLAGVFGSIVGVGGGVIIVPTIVSSCKNIPQRLVSGTSLAAVVSTAVASAYTYSAQGCIDLGAAALISPAAMLTAPLGARLTARLNCTALRRILGYFLLAAAPLVPLKAYLLSRDTAAAAAAAAEESSAGAAAGGAVAGAGLSEAAGTAAAAAAARPAGPSGSSAATSTELSRLAQGIHFPPPATSALLVATGAVAGVASGLLGVGGGLIVTPLLALTMDYPQATVLGTSLLAMIFPASAALLQHQRLGNVDWRMAASLAAGTAVGSLAGSNVAVAAPPGALEAAFCIGMLFLGRKTLATAR
ncbi:4-toluene sulfonate uptake permease [Chlorella sorokiniana]|uniref:4-toluene sulfonate uptake permease n=1 Tax=Chlorella sorokiniana TaxID=3076 RepID=A0A2P6TMD6_CHLSO|nr:4-toluene sulfonate uptake permease [Chlorella sorokiniana]|eukprot:PRW45493.1 4-toluene sulfonate uptake permease [Chlorella sorokiniana]